MHSRKLVAISLVIFTFLSLVAATTSAQAPLEPAQMPARTHFYFLWRGLPAADVRKNNALLSLWDDPGFAPIRANFTAFIASSEKDEAKNQLARQNFNDFATLLENPLVIGFLTKPDASESAPPAKWNGLFIVYDRTGKEALLSKTILAMRAQSKEIPQLTQITVADIPALKITTKNGANYWAETGKFAVGASDPAVFAQILQIVLKKKAVDTALTATPEFQEAGHLLGSGLFEFFLCIPHSKDFPADLTAKGMKVQPALAALKLDSLHSIAGHATVEGARTRLQGAVLGENSPSTLFDFWGQTKSAPTSLEFVSPETVSYNSGQINLPAIYEIAKRVVGMYLPPGQQGGPAMIEAMAQTRLGMSIPDALGLFSGEVASLQNSKSLDATKQAYFLKITKKPELLKLLHAILSDRISAEKTEGTTTFLKVSIGGLQATAALPPATFYHLAITPDCLLVSTSNETLRALLAQRKALPAGSDLAALPKLQTARAQYPESLTSLSFMDFQKFDWSAVKDRWIADAHVAAQLNKERAQNDPEGKPADAKKVPDWMTNVDPQVFARHLHYMAGASWKDARGLHFDQWLE